MPIYLERYLDDSINQNIEDLNFSLYPNPIKAGELAYLVGAFDSFMLYDLKGQPIETLMSEDGVFKAPASSGMYLLKIIANEQIYSIKLIVI